jgi:hypothetical protein
LLGKGDETRQELALGSIAELGSPDEQAVVVGIGCDAAVLLNALVLRTGQCEMPNWSFPRQRSLRRAAGVLREVLRLVPSEAAGTLGRLNRRLGCLYTS